MLTYKNFTMLYLWAYIEESDIEAFAGTLVQPDHMSHLKLAPFRLAEQPYNADGRGPLVLKYISRARVEEFKIFPCEYALRLFHYVFPSVAIGNLSIPKCSQSIWNWSPSEKTNGDEKNRLRLYFEWNKPPDVGISRQRFTPWQCFLSHSRNEIFISNEVLTRFFAQWAELLGIVIAEDDPLVLKASAGGYVFENRWIGGEYFLEKDDILENLFEFAELSPQIREMGYRSFGELEFSGTHLDDAGLSFQLDMNRSVK